LKRNSRLAGGDLARREAEYLVLLSWERSFGTKMSKIDLYSHLSDPMPLPAQDLLLQWLEQRAAGFPLQHITGVQAFLEHDYNVGPEVLVPRPETEILCATAIAELQREKVGPFLGFEIGVGSGILSIELLSRFPSLRMVASELTRDAMECAFKNAQRILGDDAIRTGRFTLLQSESDREVWEPFVRHSPHVLVDFLISNPPYLVPTDEIDDEVLTHEPKEALFPPQQDPLYFYRAIAKGAERFLRPRGYIFLEIPSQRSCAISHLFSERKWNIKVHPDLTGSNRVLIGRLEG